MAANRAKSSGASDLHLTNRLRESQSPYVRGHMNNPVAWQMWSEEALALAKKHHRLIFLSIGYAACHWCHVMERESFESEDVARLLNTSFIPIKVDREERPDVDRIYMNYVQATTGSGGWPLNVFLTPDLEPVFGGTYWPGPSTNTPSMVHRPVGFLDIVKKMKSVWEEQEERCVESAKEILSQLRKFANEGSGEESEATGEALELELLEESYQHFSSRYDKVNGGFSAAPKFATPVHLSFLLRLEESPSAVKAIVGETECKNAAAMALTTLRKMTRGGIHDHIGHGFARYSVTKDWSLPHFEKMLYDQGQLLHAYLEGFLISNDPEMLGTVYDIADYLTTGALAAPAGGFFSAEDADSLPSHGDSEKREGAFYVWSRKEFDATLTDREAEICARFWNVKHHGNVAPENDAHDEFINQNVLAIVSTPAQLAKDFGRSEEEVVEMIKSGRRKLREHRDEHRPRPNLDDKIVTSWNGLAIGALARVGAALEQLDPERAAGYLQHAKNAAGFIRTHLYDETSGLLKRVYRDGPGATMGFADDYANLISGLLDLYEASFDENYLELADRLQKTQLSQFWDDKSAGFFCTAASAPDLILRLKDGMDNVEPSANGTSAQNLYRLGSMLEDEDYNKRARKTCMAFEAEIMQHPFLFSSMTPAIVAGALGVKSVVLVGETRKTTEKRLLRSIGRLSTMVKITPGRESWLSKRNPLIGSLAANPDTTPRVMICEAGTCREEVEGSEEGT